MLSLARRALCAVLAPMSSQAALQGPEVQLVQPPEHELAALTAAVAGGGGTSSSSPQLPGYDSSSQAAAPADRAAAELERKAQSLRVLEGQTLSWSLELSNESSEPITGCKVCCDTRQGLCCVVLHKQQRRGLC